LYPLAAVPISSVADGTRGVSTKFRGQYVFSSRVRTEFFLDMVCREPYTAAGSHDLPSRQRRRIGPSRASLKMRVLTAHTGFSNTAGRARHFLYWTTFFVRRARRLHTVSLCVVSSQSCGRHTVSLVVPATEHISGVEPSRPMRATCLIQGGVTPLESSGALLPT
jgi:hypothetical protein